MTDTIESWGIIEYDSKDAIPINDIEEVKKHLYPNMLFFSDRYKLEKMFKKWCDDNNLAFVPINMIVFLQWNDLINVYATYNFLKGEQNNGNHKTM